MPININSPNNLPTRIYTNLLAQRSFYLPVRVFDRSLQTAAAEGLLDGSPFQQSDMSFDTPPGVSSGISGRSPAKSRQRISKIEAELNDPAYLSFLQDLVVSWRVIASPSVVSPSKESTKSSSPLVVFSVATARVKWCCFNSLGGPCRITVLATK